MSPHVRLAVPEVNYGARTLGLVDIPLASRRPGRVCAKCHAATAAPSTSRPPKPTPTRTASRSEAIGSCSRSASATMCATGRSSTSAPTIRCRRRSGRTSPNSQRRCCAASRRCSRPRQMYGPQPRTSSPSSGPGGSAPRRYPLSLADALDEVQVAVPPGNLLADEHSGVVCGTDAHIKSFHHNRQNVSCLSVRLILRRGCDRAWGLFVRRYGRSG